ncbi:MAG: cellulase family glycosylhydrolase [Clostridia bacterium]|nr:cellulase family glycosylhydrolase [Clostridia bacterium]
MKRFFALLLAFITASLSGCTAKETEPMELSEYQNVNAAINGILSVDNGYIVDADGERVMLRGINLGNWLLMETWMNAVPEYTSDWAHYDTLEVLNERFGAEKTEALMRVYQDSFITADDIAQIEKLGFNCVRVPFWYRNFMNEDGSWLAENAEDNPGFQKFDWLIEQCGQHGVYVILDMHGAPGGQSMNHSTGKAGRNLLYTEEEYMQTAERLWTVIAERYKESPVVSAYDLLNEPQNNGGYTGDTAWEAESEEAVTYTNEAYDRLYKAVRSVDAAHMVSLEGVWSTEVLPAPTEMGYENMLYQLHLYDTDKGMIKYRVNELRSIRKKWDAAVISGEFNHFAEESYAVGLYNKNEISYVKWTYKTLNTGDNWGIFNANTGYIDIKTASYEEIYEFFETKLSTENCMFNKEEMHAILP